jgi:cytochrome bd-type quinol oxidase subunit 1
MVIAVIAVLHVLVSHYAVGGGLFLAVETRWAYRQRHGRYLAYLKDHAWFFILVTVVYGAVTGVGIWWSIGLASPLATETLIHGFVFGWAMEYVTFLLEIAAAFAFYYWWGRLDARTHQAMGWIYASLSLAQPGHHHRHHRLHAPQRQLAAESQFLGRAS